MLKSKINIIFIFLLACSFPTVAAPKVTPPALYKDSKDTVEKLFKECAEIKSEIKEYHKKNAQIDFVRPEINITLYFNKKSSYLSRDNKAVLGKLAFVLKNCPNLHNAYFHIMGFADVTGGSEVNMQLSRRRVRSVYSYLINIGGVQDYQLLLSAYGNNFAPTSSLFLNQQVQITECKIGSFSDSTGELVNCVDDPSTDEGRRWLR